MSTSSRVLQWATTAALGLSLLTATLTMLIAASGPWAPLPWSGAAALSSRSLLLPGGACVAVGGAFVVWCARFLLAHGGTPDPCAPPQALCSSGPYATTSHPMQRGQLLVLFGLVLLVGTQGAAVVGVVLAPGVARPGPHR
jgi:protein-S-isoprenylcysteine O-methyltransferase Ste14